MGNDIKILCMDWMSKFQCVGGSCPLTCCANWKIQLTDKEITDYENMEHPFAKEFVTMIDRDKKCMKRGNDGACEALTEDGWCRLVRECGEEYLSATCTCFPRTIRQYGDTREGTVEIVCPVVAGYLLNSEPIAFEFAQEQAAVTQEIDYEIYDSLALARTYLIELIQAYPHQYVSGKVYIIFSVLYKIREFCRQGQLNRENVSMLLKTYDSNKTRSAIFTECEVMARRYETKGILLQNLLIQLKPIIVTQIFPRILREFDGIQKNLAEWQADVNMLSDCLRDFISYRDREYPSMTENFLIYILFLNWITMDLEQFGRVFSARIIELMLVQIITMSLWKERGKVDKEEYEIIIASVDRIMSHAKGLREKLYNFMAELGKDNLANILMIMI